jgi:hypothetical protein
MAVPNTFATDTGFIPLSELDANFAYYDAAISIVGTKVTALGDLVVNGNLGLGVTPSAWWSGVKALQVNGASLLSSGVTASLTANAHLNSSAAWTYTATNSATHYEQTLGQHRWYTAPSGTAGNPITFTQAMTLDESGDWLLGTTVVPAIANTSGVYIYGAGQGQFFCNNAPSLFLNRLGTDGAIVNFRRGASNVGDISVTGSATAYNTSSDYRLKNIAGPITNSGAYIDSLNPVEGTWKSDGSTFVGLIAHEVQKASRTQVATGEKDGNEMQSMDYSSPELIANLIAEIKSLRVRVASLESSTLQ